MAILWAATAWRFLSSHPVPNFSNFLNYSFELANAVATIIFFWLLVALAVLDAENLWLPDRLIWPGIALGLLLGITCASLTSFMRTGRRI